jgi:hypothetical protein
MGRELVGSADRLKSLDHYRLKCLSNLSGNNGSCPAQLTELLLRHTLRQDLPPRPVRCEGRIWPRQRRSAHSAWAPAAAIGVVAQASSTPFDPKPTRAENVKEQASVPFVEVRDPSKVKSRRRIVVPTATDRKTD